MIRHDTFSSQYDPQQYKRQIDMFSQQDSNSRSVYNPNMSTIRFLAEVDLRCDDHLTKFNEDVKADRFCSECKLLCCDACVIDYHIDHINSAKARVEDYFKKQKFEMEELRSKIYSSIKHKTVLSEFNLTMEILDKNISTFFLRRQNHLENFKLKIDSLLCEESDLCNRMKECLHAFYKDEALKRMDKPIKELDHLQSRLQIFLRDWETFSRTDKAKVLKNNQIVEFINEADELNKTIENNVFLFKNKSKIVEKNIDEIFKSFSLDEKINKIESDFNEISSNIKSNFCVVNKLNFEEISVENFENHSEILEKIIQPSISKINVDPLLLKKHDSNDFKLITDNKQYDIIENQTKEILPSNKNEAKIEIDKAKSSEMEKLNNTDDNKNMLLKKEILDNTKSSVNIPNSNIRRDSFPLSQQQKEKNYHDVNLPFEIMIGLKPKTNDIIIFDANIGFVTIKLENKFFQDPSHSFNGFPENSRYVNIGFSLLITGGYINREKTKNCYLLVATRNANSYNNQSIPYDISIMPYSNMLEARERHNLIYLSDFNSVLACSGFITQNTEICDLNTSTWKQFPKMNEMRANGTIAYVNKRFVYVFSGFRLNETKQQGIYSNTYEVLDLISSNKGWTLFNFDDIKISLKLCAMGVINISNNSILICGGFDGNKYQTIVNKIHFNDDGVITSIQPLNTQLPNNMIFLHNNFLRLNSMAYNYDLNMSAVLFDPQEKSFKVILYNLYQFRFFHILLIRIQFHILVIKFFLF